MGGTRNARPEHLAGVRRRHAARSIRPEGKDVAAELVGPEVALESPSKLGGLVPEPGRPIVVAVPPLQLGPTASSMRIETPVGVVVAHLDENKTVEVVNVPSYRLSANITIDVPGIGPVRGDVAWGGNWFFLVEKNGHELSLANAEQLTEFSWRVRQAVNTQGFPDVDHVELFGPPTVAGAHSRNFVQCPGKAYDRSPCGTGTSAKLACLAADGALAEGETWIQESVIGSSFSASFRWLDRSVGKVAPTISGRAFVTAESTLLLDADDPFCWGIR